MIVESQSLKQSFVNCVQNKKIMVAVSLAIAAVTALGIFLAFRGSNTLTASLIGSGSGLLAVSLIAAQVFFSCRKRPPTTLKERIDYGKLAVLGINQDWVSSVEAEVLNGGRSKLIDFFKNVTVKQFKNLDRPFVYWIFSIVEQLVEKEALSEEECSKIHQSLARAHCFDRGYKVYKEKGVTVDYIGLLLASSVFRTAQKYRGFNFLGIRDAVLFIEKYDRTPPEDFKTAARHFQLFDFYRLPNDHFFRDIESYVSKIDSEQKLLEFAVQVQSSEAINGNQELTDRLLHGAISVYFQKCHGAQTPFNLGNDRYAIPAECLFLLAKQGDFYEYLKGKVNTVSIKNTHPADLKVLKIHQLALFDQITSLVVTDHWVEMKPNLLATMNLFSAQTLYVTGGCDFYFFKDSQDLARFHCYIESYREGSSRMQVKNVSEEVLARFRLLNPEKMTLILKNSDSLGYQFLERNYPNYKFKYLTTKYQEAVEITPTLN